MQPPKLALAYLESKIAEAEAVQRVRAVARREAEVREELRRNTGEAKEKDARIRNLERTVKSYELAQQAAGGVKPKVAEGGEQNAGAEVLRKRVLELEAENDELKQEMSSADVFYLPRVPSHAMAPPAPGLFDSVVNAYLHLVEQQRPLQMTQSVNQTMRSTGAAS